MDENAIARAINLADYVEQDLRNPRDSLLWAQIMAARADAIDAAKALMEADPFNPKEIMRLQNDVQRYTELVTWIQDARQNATDLMAALPAEEATAILEFLNPKPEVNDA
jgi:hypothetical protein